MRESLATLRDLLTRTEFHTGIVMGTIAAAMLAILAVARAPGRARPWGLATATATLIGVQLVDDHRLGLVGGVALMAIGGALVGWPSTQGATSRTTTLDAPRLLGWAIIAAGAVLIPWRGRVEEDDWYFVATPVVAIAVGSLLSTWARTNDLRALGGLFAITTFAVWTTVPDTDLARLLLGVSLPLALATIPPISASLTSAGSFALGGVFAWIPALGGEARPASIIGAWACIGMIALVPLTETLTGTRPSLRNATLFLVHGLVVLIAARVIGLWTWAVPAAIAAIGLYAATVLLVHRLDRRSLASDSRRNPPMNMSTQRAHS